MLGTIRKNIGLFRILYLKKGSKMITSVQLWKPTFMSELVQHGFVNEGSDGYETVRQIWEQATLWILILFIVGLVWDIISGFIKVRKAKKSNCFNHVSYLKEIKNICSLIFYKYLYYIQTSGKLIKLECVSFELDHIYIC